MIHEQSHKEQVVNGKRFEFGKNWNGFLRTLTNERIEIARNSLKEMLEVQDLDKQRFLDAGCGSGLFSLAAMSLGAKVHSFDFDPQSVKCTELLRENYFPHSQWNIEEGSILDKAYLGQVGQFDIVYCWGVLHHTGNLYGGMENIDMLVKKGGKLFVAIYNDQGKNSNRWRKVKKLYNQGLIGKSFVVSTYFPYFFLKGLAADIVKLKNPVKRYTDYKTERGMSAFYDWFDWLGGLPFEVAKPEEIFEYFKSKNYKLLKLKTTSSLGCNQYVFQKV